MRPPTSLVVSIAAVLILALISRPAPAQPSASDADPHDRPPEVTRSLELLGAAREADDRSAELHALLEAADAANDARDLDLADEHTAPALELARELGDMLGEARAIQLRGTTERYRTNFAAAQSWFERAVPIFEHWGEADDLGSIYRDLGLSLRYQSEYEAAIGWYRRAQAQYELADDIEGIGDVQNSLGVSLAWLGRYDAALEAHTASLEISRAVDDTAGVASSLYNLGDIYGRLGDQELSRQYFEDALELDLETGNPGDIGHSRNKLALVYSRTGEYAKARDHALEARALFEAMEAPRNTAWSEAILGEIAVASGDLEAAETWLRGALEVATQRDASSLVGDIRESVARLAVAHGDYDRAIREVSLAIESARSAEQPERELVRLRILTDVYEARGDLAGALESLRREKALEKELFDRARASVIAERQAESESVRREREVELLRRDRALAEEQASRKVFERNVVVGGVSIGFVILFLVAGRVVQRRHNRQLSAEVEARTAELVVANRALEELGWSDPLTGCRNRRYLDDRLDGLLERARAGYADGSTEPASSDLVFHLVDLDHFKRINDDYGHSTGDRVLTEAVRVLTDALRGDDVLVRWGGEELLAVEVGASRASAAAVAERLRAAVASHPFATVDGRPLEQLTVSVGFAPYPVFRRDPRALSFDEALHVADDCLYRAKARGRNAWVGVVDDPAVEPDPVTRLDLPPVGAEGGPLLVLASATSSEST